MRVLRADDGLPYRASDESFPESATDEDSIEIAAVFSLVLVRWYDAWFDSEQQCPDDWRNEYPVQTVGFLVRDDATVISVAQEILPDGDGYRAVTHIPTSTIESVTRLIGHTADAPAVEREHVLGEVRETPLPRGA
jgi:hypothetical protein